ncbi:MAG: peptide ABC transporter substrate-binding protein [Chlamydiota bacterium]
MRSWVLSCLLLSFFCTSCNNSPQKEISEKTLRFSVNRDPSTLDPRKGGDIVASLFHFLLFEGLTITAKDGSVRPALAEKIDISEDRLTYTFHLRDAKWSDGNPITAEDFEKTWKNHLDPSFPSPNAHLFFPIKNAESAKRGQTPLNDVGIRAIDLKTFEVTLNAPTPYFLEIAAFCSFAPIPTQIAHDYPDWADKLGEHFVCNGPYILKNLKHNQECVLVKNPHYWNANAPYIDTLHINIIDNEMTTLYMFENGMLDFIASDLSPIPLDALKEYSSHQMLSTICEAGTTVCFFNTESFPFKNVHMRKAFALAMNREEIVKNISEVNETAALGPVPIALKQLEKSFFKDHDVEQAKLHLQCGLEELGLSSVQELGEIVYCYPGTEKDRKTALAIQQQWFKTLGIRVKLEQFEYKTLQSKLYTRSYTVAQGLWLAQYMDQMSILERFRSKLNVKNYSGWENTTFVKLLEDSNYAKTTEERLRILDEAETLLVEHMPVSPIFHWKPARLSQPHIKLPSCSSTLAAFFENITFTSEEK